ncbi:sialate O-acetylesterase [Arenibacter sp. N53]|uniref:sialate O-acetylesterase n=1 Tax=Arenibacter TaxID=178469 RepID=UPI000CD4693D|nr:MULTISPECIES: sialate O-acetylesterase [Arenibacter]MCM4152673.1 sialate O-acetylesterase [Arenibacter sp. N53]
MFKKLCILLFLFSQLMVAQKIKVACVGNSVTYGTTIKDRSLNSYPAQLQKLLGTSYEIGNFGHPGATLLKNGHKPYWLTPEYAKSMIFLPDLVLIHLGLNDQGNNNWPKHKDKFVSDYLEMIQAYRSLPSKPKVVICKMSPSFSGHHWFEEGMRENYMKVQAKIMEIGTKAQVAIIDLSEPLYRFPELYSDNLHPTGKGATILAQKTYQFISGDYGGLQLPPLYGENMVLQRNEPIVIKGSANANDTVSVVFNHRSISTIVHRNGQWKIGFPAMAAGGPHELSIKTKTSGRHTIKKVFIGEVWLASGQSNMDFRVRDMNNADTVLKDSLNSNIFLFSMDGKASPSDHQFTKEELLSCNAHDYFKFSGWSNSTGEVRENFSAIGYSFAFNLQKELKVPIGIICNAVGGSTTQSWISRKTMETTHETIDLLNDTHLNPMVQPWVSKRKERNLENMDEYHIKARHPFDPTLLFDAGILPITSYTIKGVIWYQGESNAERPGLHSRLFKLLIKDWRTHWGRPNLAFNFVQLSSLNRSGWGHFRDSQRRLLSIPYTGMAVSSDLGHPTDVHPKEKWAIGQRLASIALANSYDRDITFSGPLLDYVNVERDYLEVHFTNSDGLRTEDQKEVNDIQIAGMDKIFFPAQSKIKNGTLRIWSHNVKKPRYVKYGYSPYTNANLINGEGWPTSTFSNINDQDEL